MVPVPRCSIRQSFGVNSFAANPLPLAVLCTDNSVLRLKLEILTEKLNSRGKQGWELIQVSFREQRVVAFWKRERSSQAVG